VKLLFMLPAVPDPPDAGAKIRNLGLLRAAAKDHVVDAIAFGLPASQCRLAALVRRPTVVPPPPPRGPVERALGVARSAWPDVAQRLWSPDFVRQLRSLLALEQYDVVQAEGIEMARYLDVVRSADSLATAPRRIYDAHNAEFLLQRRASQVRLGAGPPGAMATALPAAAYSRLQWQRLARYERAVVAGSDLTLAVSYHDANQLTALAGPRARVRVVPNGVDVAAYPFHQPHAAEGPNVLFLGKLDYRPNAAAAAFLLADVLPRLFERRADARLFAVGAQPPPWLVSAGQRDNRIAVVGPVADERQYLQRCSALVLPIRIGGGSRLKALVALASGLPIVSTGLGMEGLEADPDVHYLRADSAGGIAVALDRLLRDVTTRGRLAARGRALVEERYDWGAIAPLLRAAYRSVEP